MMTANSLVQDRESSPAETSVLTTMLRCQHNANNHYKEYERYTPLLLVMLLHYECSSTWMSSSVVHVIVCIQ